MRKSVFAFVAVLALPLPAPALSQVPAQIDIEAVQPISGSWSYQRLQSGGQATFFDSSATQRLVIRCNRSVRSVSIVRTGVAAAAPTLSIWTSSASRSVPARFAATRTLTADVAAGDSLLDAIAFSRGRFATAAAGAPMVAVTTSPEVSRVIEDCRS
jgi:hypothetical protein